MFDTDLTDAPPKVAEILEAHGAYRRALLHGQSDDVALAYNDLWRVGQALVSSGFAVEFDPNQVTVAGDGAHYARRFGGRFMVSDANAAPQPRIDASHAPGRMTDQALRFLFPKASYHRVFAQAIADMRLEHAEARTAPIFQSPHWIKAHQRWIILRDQFRLAVTAVFYMQTSALKRLLEMWRLP
ncbi:MAG: hypothetical protein AAGF88_06970 [Pseudomonadota bacterium]